MPSILGASHVALTVRNMDASAEWYQRVFGWMVLRRYAEGEAGTPFRVEAVLAPGQSLFFSTPRAAGVATNSVELTRHGDTLLLQEEAVTN